MPSDPVKTPADTCLPELPMPERVSAYPKHTHIWQAWGDVSRCLECGKIGSPPWDALYQRRLRVASARNTVQVIRANSLPLEPDREGESDGAK